MRRKLTLLCFQWGLVLGSAHAELPHHTLLSSDGLMPLSLRQAEELFLANNRELQLARSSLSGVVADSVKATKRPNPNLSINAVNIGSSEGDQHLDTVVRVDQMFERGSKRELRSNAAQFGVEASRSDLKEIERQQHIALYAAYYDLLLAQEKELIGADTAMLAQKTMDAAALREKAGDIASTELARISVDALRAQNDARQAKADREKAQLALALIIGTQSETQKIYASDPWPEVELPAPTQSADVLIAQRADVKAAQARMQAAEQNRNLARAMRTRDVTVGVQYEHFPGDHTNNTVGIGVSIPLFINNYFQGEIGRAESDLTTAQLNLQKVRAQVLNEIAKSRAELEAAAERVKRFHGLLLEQARKAADGAEFAYAHGAMGLIDLLDARRTLFAVRIEAATAQADYAKALAAWLAATEWKTDTP